MKTAKFIAQEDLARLVGEWVGAKTRVIAPVEENGQSYYRPIQDLAQGQLSGAMPRRSLKEFFFPPSEPLLHWTQRQSEIEIEEVPTAFPPQIILGALPCDAAAVELLDKVMGWDYRDELWFGRRQATTIIGLACRGGDRSCFCTLTGLAPDAARGSDLLFIPQGNGFLVEIVSPKGEALLQAHGRYFQEGKEEASTRSGREAARQKVEALFGGQIDNLGQWLADHFENDFWKAIALRCHGCGACAMLCPTCHCFDIVDEPEGVCRGTRRRNWDTCQTAKFTVHGSGHNPRGEQNARFRQRLMHKFSIYPRRFEAILCSGCGRCARACPGGMDLPELLNALAAETRAKKESKGAAR